MLGYDSNFRERLQELDSSRKAEKDKSPTIVAARKRLEEAKEALESSEQRLAQIPINHLRPDHRRGPLYAAIEAQKQEIEDAETALNKAENSFIREKRLAKLKADRDAINQQHAQEQAENAQRKEALAKTKMSMRFIEAGGTPEQFEKAWPDMWQAELVRRATLAQPSTAFAGHLANLHM